MSEPNVLKHLPDERAFLIRINGRERLVPDLPGADRSRWVAAYAATMAAGKDALDAASHGADSEAGITSLRASSRLMHRLVDALVAYDVTKVLGGREWIEAHMTPEQLVLTLRRIAQA